MADFSTSVAPPSPAALDIRPPAFEDPIQAILRYRAQQQALQQGQQTLAQGQQEQQLNAQKIQAGQMGIDQTRAVNDAYRDAYTPGPDGTLTLDPAKMSETLARGGHGVAIPSIVEAHNKLQKSYLDLQEGQQKVAAAEQDAAGNLASTVKAAGNDPGLFHALFTDAMNRRIITQAHYAPLEQQLQTAMQQDPTGAAARDLVGKFTDQMIQASPKQTELAATRAKTEADLAGTNEKKLTLTKERRGMGAQELSSAIDPQTGIAPDNEYARIRTAYPDLSLPDQQNKVRNQSLIRSAVPIEKQPEFDLNTMKSRMGVMGNSEYDQFLVQYSRKLGKTPATLTPDEGLASFEQYAVLKQDPQMRAAALAQKNLADSLKRIQLDQMPTEADAQRLADDIQNHRIAPSQLSEIRGRGNGALGLMITRNLPKGFNWQDADAEYNLAKSPGFQQQVRYMDYVGSSVDRVIAAADRLNNGRIRSLNAIKNAAADQLNGVDIAKFQADRLEVADAIAKILQGGGTGAGTSDAKLQQASELIKTTDSPAVVRAKMGEIKELINTRRQTLTRGTFMENAQPAAPTAAAGQQYKAGETRVIGGVTYKRDNAGTWHPQ